MIGHSGGFSPPGYTMQPQRRFLSGKTGLGLLQVAGGLAILFFRPEFSVFAMGMITSGGVGLGIGGVHKIIKSNE